METTTANLPTAGSVIAVDPSEAVRSAEIVPVLRRYFEIVEHKPGFFPSFVPMFLRSNVPTFDLADIAATLRRKPQGTRRGSAC